MSANFLLESMTCWQNLLSYDRLPADKSCYLLERAIISGLDCQLSTKACAGKICFVLLLCYVLIIVSAKKQMVIKCCLKPAGDYSLLIVVTTGCLLTRTDTLVTAIICNLESGNYLLKPVSCKQNLLSVIKICYNLLRKTNLQ